MYLTKRFARRFTPYLPFHGVAIHKWLPQHRFGIVGGYETCPNRRPLFVLLTLLLVAGFAPRAASAADTYKKLSLIHI